MDLSSNCKKILIFRKTKHKALELFEEILNTIDNNNISRLKRSTNETLVELKDGTIYQIVQIIHSSRGCKCNKAYVDRDIDKKTISCVIKPMLLASNLPENEQIEYF